MPFTYRDRPSLSERLRGKSGEEILNEMKCDLDKERRMFFDSPRRARNNNSGFPRAFPFDDYSNPTTLRSYLDELATRHPEFADQLKEPPWSEEFVDPSFGGNYKASKSGKSGSNSRSEFRINSGRERPCQNLNQFGLRNTVPFGQNINTEEQRRQRSMSAPPDNRSTDKPKRFISKCEIPINQDPIQEPGKPPATPKPSQEQSQSKPNNSPNIRLIPIQVEGRDEPIINADIDASTNFGGEKFRDPPFEGRLPRDFGSYQKHSPRFAHKEKVPPSQVKLQTQPQVESMPIPMPMPMTMPTSTSTQDPLSAPVDEVDSKSQESVPKAEPLKDPLTKVENIQKEVDELRQKVEAFDGTSRSDKQFMMLDELLTRKLISLDDIDTEGKENVRQARKDTIKSIQRCISLLESRIPLSEENTGLSIAEEKTNDDSPSQNMEIVKVEDRSVAVTENKETDVKSGENERLEQKDLEPSSGKV